MEEKIIELKKLNAAYIAAFYFGCCPKREDVHSVTNRFNVGKEMSDIILDYL